MHSTESALLKVTSDIMMAADDGRCSVLVLLNLSFAFYPYLSDRTYSVAVGQLRQCHRCLFQLFQSKDGVHLGQVTGP